MNLAYSCVPLGSSFRTRSAPTIANANALALRLMVEKKTEPPSLSEEPYSEDLPPLPGSLMEAVAALKEDRLFRDRLGDAFVDYILMVKECEIRRFLSYVTDWEHREYFEVF